MARDAKFARVASIGAQPTTRQTQYLRVALRQSFADRWMVNGILCGDDVV
ncbi:MAG: hypothetical protein IPM54_12210 [Polyangiaceae bacterium]|nr:hypothetical protein [Polyangiaceae bacterium]